MNWRRKSLAPTVLVVMLLAPWFSAVQRCFANPGVTVYLSQYSGPIGITVTVSGQIENPGAQFKIFWRYIRDWDGRYGLVASGYAEGFNYKANITIPPAAAGQHYVIVEDEKNHATGYAIFTVTPKIAVNPNIAPSGVIATVSGRLINGETISIKFCNPVGGDEQLVAQAATDAVTGEFSCRFTVPLKPAGNYVVRAYWNGLLQAEASFTILPPAQITVASDAANPNEALPGYSKVSVRGQNFIANEKVLIFFESDRVQVAEATTGSDGTFSTYFVVPSDATAGEHTITAVQDSYNVSVSAVITVDSVEIRPYATLYVPGDTICFSVNSTTPFDATAPISIKIQDPSKVPFALHAINVGDLVQLNGRWVVPYDKATISPVVPKGAPVGFWTWSATYFLQLYPGVQFNVSGVFQVIPESDLSYVLQRLNEINARIAGMAYKQDQLYLLVETNHNTVMARLDQLEGTLVSITQNGFAQINTVLGQISVKLNMLNAQVTDIKDGVVSIQTSLGTMTADVSTIKNVLSQLGAKITGIADGVTQIQTGVGTLTAKLDALNASVVSVGKGLVAVNTAIGELKASLADLKANVTALIINSENKTIVELQTLLGPVNATLEDVLIPGLGEVKALVVDAKGASENASQAVSALNTLIYVVVVLSLIAAALSVANLLAIRQKLAPS